MVDLARPDEEEGVHELPSTHRAVGSAAPMNKKERRTAASREALLAGARKVLEEYGYRRATVTLVTRAAQRSHGTFYLHFDNKEDIYGSLLDDMRKRLHEESKAVWRADEPLGSVERSIDAYVRSFASDRPLWQLLDGASAESARFRAARREIRNALVRDIRQGIVRSLPKARLDGLKLDVVAEILAAMLEETCVTFLLHRNGVDPETITRHVTTLWGRMLGYPAHR